ncbi:MAG: AMP-binding protein [Lysobacter sp.]|nr:AMP-binding protein [Lysobacter sp.]
MATYHLGPMEADVAQYDFPAVARPRRFPLRAGDLLAHAARVHADRRVVSISRDGEAQETDYAHLQTLASSRALQLMTMELRPGDRIASIGDSSIEQLAWLYGALQAGVITHLVNPQHEAAHVHALLMRAGVRLVLHDAHHEALSESLAQAMGVPALAMSVPNMAATPPDSTVTFNLPEFDECAPSHVCYSSGTTGLPKIVEYTHRALVLHAWGCALPGALALTGRDRVMPLMQLYHANAWGAPFVCPLVGAELVLCPPVRDPAFWHAAAERHGVTVLAAVTAHWLALLQYCGATGQRFSSLRRTVVAGTRMPVAVARGIAQGLSVAVSHAWGMTETSPLATIEHFDPADDRLAHGQPVFGVEVRTTGEGALAELQVRGHWIACREPSLDGWLSTGDLATIDARARVDVIDRIGDVVRHGAGAVSSALVEFEARTVGGVADAALLPGDDVDARTTLAWVAAGDADAAHAEDRLRSHLAAAFDGWVPDRIVATGPLPYTPSAKVQKHKLRERIRNEDGSGALRSAMVNEGQA